MSNSIFWRLVWKEYRLQRALWISMLLLTVLLQSITLIAWMILGGRGQTIVPLFGLALGFPAFYALGCGATLFAAEHEAGTYEFQRVLPISALPLFFGKFVFAATSTLAMVGLSWLSAAILAGWQWPRPTVHLGLWGLWGFAAVELLVWGVFFSLLSTRPLRAAILAVTAASVTTHFVFSGLGLGHIHEAQTYLNPASVPHRAAIAAVVALLDIGLGYRWFRTATLGSANLARAVRGRASVDELVEASWATAPQRTMVLGRLLWQQWRQSVGMMGTLGTLVLPLGLVGLWVWGTEPFARNRYNVLVVLAAGMASLMGSCVFLADQRKHHFRILAEQGVPPRYIWLSRQLVWIAPVMLLIAALLPLFFLRHFRDVDGIWVFDYGNWYRYSSSHWDRGPSDHFALMLGDAGQLAFFLGSVGLAYASGQLCSMFLRSGLLAAIFGLFLSLTFCGWAGLMWWWEVSWFWSVAPIPGVLLLATWLRAPGWLLQRNGPRAWLLPGLSLAVPAAVLLAAVAMARVFEIPEVDPGFSPEEYARPITPEEQQTVDIYRRAMDLYVPLRPERKPPEDRDVAKAQEATPQTGLTARQIDWIDDNREAIGLALEASRRKACDFFDPIRQRNAWRSPDGLADLLVLTGRKLQSEGKLDAALDRYMAALRVSVHLRRRAQWPRIADRMEKYAYKYLTRWAAHPEQTPERIRGAIEQLQELDKDRPSQTDAIKSEYVWMQRIISGDPDALAATGMDRRAMIRTMLWARWLPWEAARARRMLNRQTAADLEVLRDTERRASLGESVPRPNARPYIHWDREPQFALRKTIELPHVDYGGNLRDLVIDFIRIETRRRAVRLQLALAAWRAEHGELPDTLDALAGSYLDRLPVDPCSGEPFRYFPEGLPIRARWEEESHRGRWQEIDAGRPFVWSAGLNVRISDRDKDKVYEQCYLYRHDAEWDPWAHGVHNPRSEYEVWQWGWLFPLPEEYHILQSRDRRSHPLQSRDRWSRREEVAKEVAAQ